MALITKLEDAAKKIAKTERKNHGFGPVGCEPRVSQIMRMESKDIVELYDRVVGDYKLSDCLYARESQARTHSFVDHSYDIYA